jgi:hypothetical protein
MKCAGRLAQRLERSVYTRKVVRSNRTVPTICAQYRTTLSGDVVQLVRTLPCHGRGREFESRRPRHIFKHLHETREKIWVRLGPISQRNTPPAVPSLERILESTLQHQLLNES